MKKTLFVLVCLFSVPLFAGSNPVNDNSKETQARKWIKNMPLEFTENKGQITTAEGEPAEDVLFKTSFGNCDIYITSRGLSYVFLKFNDNSDLRKITDRSAKYGESEAVNKTVMTYRLDMNLDGASIDKENIIKEEESSQGVNNYFYSHCKQGITGVKSYGKITVKNIYKGIDWVIYANPESKQHPLKYDFVVHPQADYRAIKMKFLNAQHTSLTENETRLKIETIAGRIEEGNLYSYIDNDAGKQKISGNYVMGSGNLIGFAIGDYDKTKTLIIDPLVWATYYGGSGTDEFNSIGIDSENNIYIVGSTYASQDFPTQQDTGAYWQPANAGGEYEDGFIVKFNSQGVRQWATYYGGTGSEVLYGVCIDSEDNIVVSGCTTSDDFPSQQMTGAYWQPDNQGTWDICIMKFNHLGERQWATCYGGTSSDFARSMCLDNQDNIYITGETSSTDLPLQQVTGAYWQPNNTSSGASDPYILKFNNQGARVWATYYGGSTEDRGYCIRTDHQNNVYMTGYTLSVDFPVQPMPGAYWQLPNTNYGLAKIFLIKFNDQGARQWATYYGGTGHDLGYGIGVDSQDNVFFTGCTRSTDFPTQQSEGAYWQAENAGMDDIFILKFDDQCVRQWATYYGGSENDYTNAIYEDSGNNSYITGNTLSPDFPVWELAGEYFQPDRQGSMDAFMIQLDGLGARQWATYYGSDDWDFGTDIGIDHQDSVYFIGTAWGNDAFTFDPGTGAYCDSSFNGSRDGYIFKITPYIPPYPIGVSNNPDGDDRLSSPIPNPAYKFTRINYKLPEGILSGELVFDDLLGNEVKRIRVDHETSTLHLNTNEFKSGTYFYHLQLPGQISGGKKLVVIN